MSSVSTEEKQKYSCPVCLEIFENPVLIPSCRHRFCKICVEPLINLPTANSTGVPCPVCRQKFNPKNIVRDRETEQFLSTKHFTCWACNRSILAPKMRSHVQTCSQTSVYTTSSKIQPVGSHFGTVSQPPPPPIGMNRSTFSCPVCGQKNLDTDGLIHHVKSFHAYAPTYNGRNDGGGVGVAAGNVLSHSSCYNVVCPICAAMPWGNPNQTTPDLLVHLLRRHQFEYDTFVDFNLDEDKVLSEVMLRSMQEK